MPCPPLRRLLILPVILLVLPLCAQEAQQKAEPPAGTQTQRPKRVRVSEGVSQALLIKKVPPEYPAEARKQHVQGQVLLKARISDEGDVLELVLISGDPALAPAAIDAVRQWKYKPYFLNGEPVEVETQVHVNFVLSPK
jgi:protein TonB